MINLETPRKFAGLVMQNRGMSMKAGATTKKVFAASFILGFMTFL